jgi:TctA family transporter
MGDLYILEDKNFINSIIIGYLVGTISVTIFGLLLAGPISKIFRINKYFFIAFVALVTWWAIISSNFYEFILEDSIFFIVFSFCGFMLKHFKISRPAVLLGFILSERLEQFSYQLIDLYSFQEIIIRPFVIIIMLLSILMVIFSKKVKVDYV